MMAEKVELLLLLVEVNQNNWLIVAQNLTIRKLLVTGVRAVHKKDEGEHQVALKVSKYKQHLQTVFCLLNIRIHSFQ